MEFFVLLVGCIDISKYSISILDSPLPFSIGFQDSSSIASEMLYLYNIITYYVIVIMIFCIYIITCVISYNTKDNITYRGMVHGSLIEIIWTIVPAFILLAIAVPSFILLYLEDEIIEPLVTLKCIGKQWYWSYELMDYNKEHSFDSYISDPVDNYGSLRLLYTDFAIVLPIDTHIKLLCTSMDVIHSFAIPSLGLKCDAIPGRINQVSMYLNRSGSYFGMCSELCGPSHAYMPIHVIGTDLSNYVSFIDSL